MKFWRFLGMKWFKCVIVWSSLWLINSPGSLKCDYVPSDCVKWLLNLSRAELVVYYNFLVKLYWYYILWYFMVFDWSWSFIFHKMWSYLYSRLTKFHISLVGVVYFHTDFSLLGRCWHSMSLLQIQGTMVGHRGARPCYPISAIGKFFANWGTPRFFCLQSF